jgi:xanthine/uracil permease
MKYFMDYTIKSKYCINAALQHSMAYFMGGVTLIIASTIQLPPLARKIQSPSVTIAGFCAIIMNILIPNSRSESSTTPI